MGLIVFPGHCSLFSLAFALQLLFFGILTRNRQCQLRGVKEQSEFWEKLRFISDKNIIERCLRDTNFLYTQLYKLILLYLRTIINPFDAI